MAKKMNIIKYILVFECAQTLGISYRVTDDNPDVHHVYSVSGLEAKVGYLGAQAKLTSTLNCQVSKARGLRQTCEKKFGLRLLSCLSLLDIWHISISPH